MREILFRGKTIKQKNGVTTEKPIKENMWVYGNLTVGKIEGYKTDMISNKKEIYYINSDTIGQFTGLTDKNGKKIFEGDIVRLCNGTYPIKVFWDCLGWKFLCNGKLVEGAFDCDIKHDIEICEVIGNIHDNPELLEKSNEN